LDKEDNLKSSELYIYNEEDLKDEKNKQNLTDIYTEGIKDEILGLRDELKDNLDLDE